MEGSPSAPFASVRLELAKLRISDELSLREACAKAARLSAEALGIARVGIWVFEDDHTRLRCIALHAERQATAQPVLELRADEFPTYVEALRERRWIAAPDARKSPLTRELTEAYLEPQNIQAMLDAPIFRGEEVFGIVCQEDDSVREWSEHDRAFAGSIADILALLFEQAGHVKSERSRRALETERRHHLKLELIARMALSVAHDVNNVLTTVQLLIGGLPTTPENAAVTSDVLTALGAGAALTRELLEIAKQQPNESPTPADATATTLGLASVLKAMTRGQATISMNAPDGPLVVQATASQIQQILLNLVVNARDAIKNGGRITVSVERHARDGRALARLRVRDTGTGIPDHVRAHLYQPYFSTKPSGTGLGLTLVREIVESCDGWIEVDSILGEGTTFDVWLPLVERPPSV